MDIPKDKAMVSVSHTTGEFLGFLWLLGHILPQCRELACPLFALPNAQLQTVVGYTLDRTVEVTAFLYDLS